jgi:hypothetical protein
MHAPHFFPEQAGRDYTPSPYLELLAEMRDDFTVVSGLAHPDVGASHDSNNSFLTAAPHPERRAGFRNAISLDQVAAEKLHGQTRFASLTLSCEGLGLAWTRSGAPVPADCFPSSVFTRLFLEGRPDEIEGQKRRLEDGQSILDTVAEEAKKLQSTVGPDDREKLDEYFTSVRELEQRLAQARVWSQRPKPKVDAKPPQNIANPTDLVGKTRLWFDLIHLALQTDSTRLITLQLLGTSGVPPINGVNLGHHDLSHHGQDPAKIDQLKTLELEKMKTLRDFLQQLRSTREDEGNLLDRTIIFFGSNLGNAATHGVKNLPVLVAGGGFAHGQHLAFDPNDHPPLSNLFVTFLQQLGLEVDRFGSSTGTLRGLDVRGV